MEWTAPGFALHDTTGPEYVYLHKRVTARTWAAVTSISTYLGRELR